MSYEKRTLVLAGDDDHTNRVFDVILEGKDDESPMHLTFHVLKGSNGKTNPSVDNADCEVASSES